MHFVISVCMTLSLAWLAVFVTASGLQTSVEAATLIQTSHLEEYKAHLCGSIRAAIANLEGANELLQSLDETQSYEYQKAAEFYLLPLEGVLSSGSLPWGDLNCADNVTTLHKQSVGETPHNLPNLVYRLSLRDDGSAND